MKKDWVECTLGEIVIYSKGKKPKVLSKEKTKDLNIPYINIKAFEKSIYDEYTDGFKCNLCNDGDLLMVWDGARSGLTGRAKKGAVGSTLMKIEPSSSFINKEYLYYFLSSKYVLLNTNPRGVGIPHVEPNLLWNSKFIIHNLPIQRAIVAKIEELFSSLDSGIADLEKAQKQLVIYRQAVLKTAFETYKDSSKPIKNVVKKVQIGPFGSQLHKADYIIDGIPLINPMHIQAGKIKPNPNYTISKEKRDSLPNYILQEGDVIMGRRGEMGRSALVTKKEVGWFCGTGSLYLRPDSSLLSSNYLNKYIQSSIVKEILTGKATGTTMMNLNKKIISNLPIPIPTFKQQHQIVCEIESRLSVCDKVEESIVESLEKAKALRQSILKKAFEGKLLSEEEIAKCKREKDYEPAYKLLERIKGREEEK